jgi:hypothetical protein
MSLYELILAVAAVAWIAQAARSGKHFEHAWIALFVGVGLLFTRRFFVLGLVLAAASLAVLTLPLARAEWQRLHERRDGRPRAGGPPPQV